jgi:hypothetical protein
MFLADSVDKTRFPCCDVSLTSGQSVVVLERVLSTRSLPAFRFDLLGLIGRRHVQTPGRIPSLRDCWCTVTCDRSDEDHASWWPALWCRVPSSHRQKDCPQFQQRMPVWPGGLFLFSVTLMLFVTPARRMMSPVSHSVAGRSRSICVPALPSSLHGHGADRDKFPSMMATYR